jgi:beta-lactamase class A
MLALGAVAVIGTGIADVSLAQSAPTHEAQTAASATSTSSATPSSATQTAAAQSSAASTGICTSARHPKLAARISRGITAALRGRDSVVGVDMADVSLGLTCQYHQNWHFDAASVIKATIISALLRKVGGVSHLTAHQQGLAWQMITESNDNAATALWNDVGMRSMQSFLNAAKMTHTELNAAWGLTELTAADEVTLLKLLGNPGPVLSNASRRYVLWLMGHVTSSQRWGVPAGAASDVSVHVKNGWLPYPTLWHINSIGEFNTHGFNYQIAVLTEDNASMGYGIDTIQGVARVINRNLGDFKP